MSNHLLLQDGRYYIRRRVPLDLISVFKRSTIKQALGTSDKAEAKVLCRAKDTELDVKFADARAALTAATSPANPYAISSLSLEEQLRLEEPDTAEADDAAIEIQQRRTAELEDAISRVMAARDQAARTASASAALTNDKLPGDKSLTDIVAAWAKERGIAMRTLEIHERAVRRFEEMVNKLPVRLLTRAHVIEFKEKFAYFGDSDQPFRRKVIADSERR